MEDVTHWLNAIGRKPLMPERRIIHMIKLMRETECETKRKKIRSKIVECNLGLAASFVSRHMKATNIGYWGSPSTVDYLQMAVIGMTRAVDSFDVERGYKFSTYAVFWMRSIVGRYSMADMLIYVPETAQRQAKQYMNDEECYTKHGGVLSRERLAETAYAVARAKCLLSLDYKETEDGLALADSIADKERVYDPESFGFSQEMQSIIDSAKLSKIEVNMVTTRYIDELSLVEMQKIYGMTKGQLASALTKILKKLKEAANPAILAR